MSDWPETRLADVCAKPQYGAIASGSPEPSGPLFVRQTDITRGVIDWSSVPYCDLEADSVAKYLIQRGDLLISRLGNGVGNAATVRESHGAVFAGYLVRFRTDQARAIPEFVGYQLQTPSWRAHVRGYRSGAAQPTMNAQQMGDFRFQLPSLEEQKRITSVLGAFDDLIETSLNTAKLADELWRAVLKSALSSGAEQVALSSLAVFVNGRNFTKDASGTGLPVIRTPEVRTGPSDSTIRNDVNATVDRMARAGDILFVWSGSLLVSRWSWEPGLINQHVFKVLPGEGVPDWLVMFAVEELMNHFQGVAADKATTMGHIKRSDLDRRVIIPPRSSWSALDAVIRPFWDESLSARMHISDLTRTRDELLPLLMSGKVRVDESLKVA